MHDFLYANRDDVCMFVCMYVCMYVHVYDEKLWGREEDGGWKVVYIARFCTHAGTTHLLLAKMQ